MGERLNGIQEVGSSILPGSTNSPNDYNELSAFGRFFFVSRKVINSYKQIFGVLGGPIQIKCRVSGRLARTCFCMVDCLTSAPMEQFCVIA